MHQILSLLLLLSYFTSSHANILSRSPKYYQDTLSARDSVLRFEKMSAKSYSKGDLEGFKNYSNEILTIAKEHNFIEFKIRSLIHLAIYDQRKDRYDRALVKFIEAKEAASYLNDSSYLKIVLNTNLGNCYNGMKDYDNAKKTMEQVLKLAEYHRDDQKKQIKVTAMNVLGIIASDQEKYTEALNYYDKIKDILKEENKNELAVLHINIASSYLDLKNYEEALKNGQEALRILGKETFIEVEASAKLTIGAAYYGLKDYSNSIKFLESSNKIASKDGFLLIKMDTHKYLAEVYETTSNINGALKEHKEYTAARDKYLKTLTNAQRLKFENDSNYKSLKIDSQQDVINFLNKKRTTYLFIGFIVIVLLSFFVYRNYKKKKLFQNDKSFLENENELLKDRLNRMVLSTEKTPKIRPKKKSSLSIEDQEFYKEKILNHMEVSKSYLNSEIKQIDIARELDMSSHLLSEILTTCFNKNFNSLINLYRINEAKQLMRNPKYKDYKIIALAYESGFSSKPSFNRVFKNLVGCTPSEFQKRKSA